MSADRLPALVLGTTILMAGAITYRAFAGDGDASCKFTTVDYRSMPASFNSVEEARRWARGNANGGRVDPLSVPGASVSGRMLILRGERRGGRFPLFELK